MTFEELKELFKFILRESEDDICTKCAHCESTKCSKGAWGYDSEGNIVGDVELYAQDYCVDGLYERFKANKK